MLFTAFLTAYYTFRLYFRVFEGPEVIPPPPAGAQGQGHDAAADVADAHAAASESAVQSGDVAASGVDAHLASPAHEAETGGHDHHHGHEPPLMVVSLVVLAIGAILAGYLNWPERHGVTLGSFLGHSRSLSLSYDLAYPLYKNTRDVVLSPVPFGREEFIEADVRETVAALHRNLMIVSGLIAVLGIYIAYVFHLRDRAAGERLPQRYPAVNGLLEGKYRVDEIYQAAIVEPLRTLGRAFFMIDQWVVDGIVWAIGFVPQLSGFALKLTTQRGYLQGYAVTMLFGIAIILLIVFL
jgi:NADH-quinone oxidoreductase subunit L